MIFIKIFSKIPFFLLYTISDILFFIVFYVVGYRRKVVFSNLRRSFPDKDEKAIREIAKKSYKNLLDVILETIKLMTISEEQLVKRVYMENPELLRRFYLQKKSVIVLTAHHCNWEWLTASATIQIDHAVDAVYLRLTSDFSEKLMLYIRSKFGAHPIEKMDYVKSLVKRRHILKVNALMADQGPRHEADVLWTTFLHQETKFFTGAEKIAKKMDLPVLYVEMQRVKRGYYSAHFSILADEPASTKKHDITFAYIRALESTIKSRPSDWLWSHKRWKYTRKKGVLEEDENL